MSLNELLSQGGLAIIILLSLIEISPIKINPWKSIAKSIGRALNADLKEEIDKNQADVHRYRILRFNDELLHDKTRLHSREHFNQIIDEDIMEYKKYCNNNKDYTNGKAKFAMRNIEETWENNLKTDSFLK